MIFASDDQVIEFANDLWSCVRIEFSKHENQCCNVLVAIVRKYNRVWNKKAEEWINLEKDGFNKMCKIQFEQVDHPEFDLAARYL